MGGLAKCYLKLFVAAVFENLYIFVWGGCALRGQRTVYRRSELCCVGFRDGAIIGQSSDLVASAFPF